MGRDLICSIFHWEDGVGGVNDQLALAVSFSPDAEPVEWLRSRLGNFCFHSNDSFTQTEFFVFGTFFPQAVVRGVASNKIRVNHSLLSVLETQYSISEY